MRSAKDCIVLDGVKLGSRSTTLSQAVCVRTSQASGQANALSASWEMCGDDEGDRVPGLEPPGWSGVESARNLVCHYHPNDGGGDDMSRDQAAMKSKASTGEEIFHLWIAMLQGTQRLSLAIRLLLWACMGASPVGRPSITRIGTTSPSRPATGLASGRRIRMRSRCRAVSLGCGLTRRTV